SSSTSVIPSDPGDSRLAATNEDFEVPPSQEPTEWRGDGDYYYPVSRSHGENGAPASPRPGGLDELRRVLDRLKAELVDDARDAARWASCVASLEAEIRRLHCAHAEPSHPAATFAQDMPTVPDVHSAVA